ncbi:MAG: ATP-binding protein, partial [Dehalococcoidia bacterium]
AGAGILLAAVLVALALPHGPVPPVEGAPAEAPGREALASLLDLFSEGILLLDEDRTVIAANRAAARMLARPREGMTGVSLIRAARDHALLDLLREPTAEPREVVLADQRVVFASVAHVESGDIRTVVTLQDLTPLRRAERARQELVANVSHELRTPIAAAMALAETLESGVEDEAQRARFHAQLSAEIGRLGRMVDRLLRLSRIESRAEEFHTEDLDAHALLAEARSRIAPVAERRAIAVEVAAEAAREAETAGPLRVHGDGERVLEVLSNLLDNAVRHAPEGSTVTLSAAPEAGLVCFTVRDQGPGITPQERARIFERFYTGDRARPEGGAGLGLAIARHIVSRHGGEIWVADESPGAALCFTLPAAGAPEAGRTI